MTTEIPKSDTRPTRHLRKTLTWRDGVAISMTIPAALFSTFGYFIGVINAWTAIAIWVVGFTIAFVQNKIFAEMAAMFPRNSGGISRYAMEGWKRYFAPLGAVSAFGYWLGWSLSIAVAAAVFGELIVATWFPDNGLSFQIFGNELGLSHIIAVAGMIGAWAVNYFGVKIGAQFTKILGVFLILGLALIAIACLVSPNASWDASRLNWGFEGDWRTVVVVFYVTAWAAYGTEISASFAPEYKRTARDTARALRVSTVLMLVIFFVIPLAVVGRIGEEAVAANPVTYMVVALQQTLGGAAWIGTTIVLAALLVAMISCTADGGRALYGLAQEGMTLKQFDWLNRWGVPGRSLTVDLVVNVAILLLVGTPVSILLASNFGYLLAIILALSAFILLRKDRPDWPRPIRLGRHWKVIAAVLVAVNAFVTFIGFTNPSLLGYGGIRESIIAVAILLISVALFVFRRVVQDKLPMQWRVHAPATPDADDAAALDAEMADIAGKARTPRAGEGAPGHRAS